MLSLMNVQCPHCAAKGKIMTPPQGAIIVGPCPDCNGMVAIFGGEVLPLDNDIMAGDNLEEKQEHLLEVLGVFLQNRIKRLFENHPNLGSNQEAKDKPTVAKLKAVDGEEDGEGSAEAPISDAEFKVFLAEDLSKIDDPEYFRSVFHS